MRRTRVDRDQAHRPCVTLEGGRGSGVRRYGGKGFSGIEGCPRHIGCDHFYQTCAWVR